jgi:Flp pilus assembly protein TadG
MYSQQLADAARAAALAADTALQRLAAPEDHHRTQIAGARSALERLDGRQALCAFTQTSGELAAALARRDHARTVEALCDLHAAAMTVAVHARTAHRQPPVASCSGRRAR